MNYYNEIKNELISNEINRKVKNYSINKSELNTYYNVGRLLLDAGKQYGESIIKKYSLRLTEELGPGYSQRNLRNMRQFYKVSQKWQTVSAKLSWSHYCEILWFDDNKFQYYVKIAELNNLSIRQLRKKIKSNEYERLPEFTKNKLLNQDKQNVVDFVKNPIKIKNNNKYGTAINMEWLLRDYLDDERKIYVYNDRYYKDYILNLESPQFSELINFIQEDYGDAINLGKMHLWLMAIDYFPDYKSKYKIYLKMDEYNLSILRLVRKYFGSQYGFSLSDSIDEFIKRHSELKLYGFAICVDDKGKKSINMYFVSREE